MKPKAPNRKRCNSYVLFDYMDAPRGPAEDQQMMDHLWKCPECRRRFVEFVPIYEMLAEVRNDPIQKEALRMQLERLDQAQAKKLH